MTHNDMINSKINGTKATLQEQTSNTMLVEKASRGRYAHTSLDGSFSTGYVGHGLGKPSDIWNKEAF